MKQKINQIAEKLRTVCYILMYGNFIPFPNEKQSDSKENQLKWEKVEEIRKQKDRRELDSPLIYYIAKIILEMLKAKKMRKFKIWH